MRRREFIGSLIGMAAAWPFVARAQESKEVPRVGVLWHAGNAEEEAPYLRALEQGLKDLGYVDGRTIKLEHRFPNEIPDFGPLAAELVALKVDVSIACGWNPVRLCLIDPTCPQPSATRPSTLIRFSRARNRPTCPSNSPR